MLYHGEIKIMNLTENARAVCPYYKRINGREIQCEGCVKRARLVFVFRTAQEATGHKRRYCDQYCWSECDYAQLLSAKWTSDFKRV